GAERRRGWAVEDGHVTPGFASVAAPVLDHGGRPTAAVGVTFPHECPGHPGRGLDRDDRAGDEPGRAAHRITERAGREEERTCGEEWPELARLVRRAAAELTTRIGGTPGTAVARPPGTAAGPRDEPAG
ncbi:MAG TPA: IclR family transcriptional regulator C-terminal domain-containing protein, partial [Pseudonocardiaceae bacterium]